MGNSPSIPTPSEQHLTPYILSVSFISHKGSSDPNLIVFTYMKYVFEISIMLANYAKRAVYGLTIYLACSVSLHAESIPSTASDFNFRAGLAYMF